MSTQKLRLRGKFIVDHFDKAGTFKGRYEFNNGITNSGKNNILDTYFNALTQISAGSWYIGLIDGSGTPALVAGDTLASHSGWTEFTSYTGSRQAWGQGSAASQAVTNASPATFNINATGNLYGILICSAASGGSGALWSTAAFSAVVPVANGDQMKVTYTLAT